MTHLIAADEFLQAMREAAEKATPGNHRVWIIGRRGEYTVSSVELLEHEQSKINDGIDGGSVTSAYRDYLQSVTNPKNVLRLIGMVPRWEWLDTPNTQGWWWHWDENPEHAPHIYSILTSLSRKINREFIAYPDSRWCNEVGGKWQRIAAPALGDK